MSRHLCLAVCCLECQYFQCFSWSSLHFSSPNTTITTLCQQITHTHSDSLMLSVWLLSINTSLLLVSGVFFHLHFLLGLWWWAAGCLCCPPPWGWSGKTGPCWGTSSSRHLSSDAGTWTPRGCTRNDSWNMVRWVNIEKKPNWITMQ